MMLGKLHIKMVQHEHYMKDCNGNDLYKLISRNVDIMEI